MTSRARSLGSTFRTSPSTAVTLTRAPASTGWEETASQNSPCTNTFPAGFNGVCAMPISSTMPEVPVSTLLALARRISDSRKTVMMAKGRVRPMAVVQ